MSCKKALAALLAVSMLGAVGCGVKNTDKEDAEKITEATEGFVTALKTDDAQLAASLTDGFDLMADTELDRELWGDDYDIIMHSLSFIEIAEFGEVEFDREDNTAVMSTTFSFLDLDSMIADLPTEYLTHDEWISAMDECDERSEKTFSLEFSYEEESEQWYLDNDSAEKIVKFFRDRACVLSFPVYISQEDARAYFDAYIDAMVNGDCEQFMDETNEDTYRVYDPVTVRGEGDLTEEALENFISAYMAYVMDHDPEITEDDPYHYTITGQAPSCDELSDVLYTEEFRVNYFMNFIRRGDWSTSLISDLLWDEQSSYIYNSLAETIPHCSPEDYTLMAYIDPYAENPEETFTISTELINEPSRTIYEADHSMTWDETRETVEQALDNLLEAGEIDEYEYAGWMAGLTAENYGFTTSDTVSSSGHPNQAAGTNESVPDWCDDGSIIYGHSNPDENGVWMFYSKEPGVLDTAGYYIGDGGVWVMNFFERDFDAGTTLIVDWWIDDELVVDTETIDITEDGTQEIEVFLDENPHSGQVVEMRLWDDRHSYVYSYVILYF